MAWGLAVKLTELLQVVQGEVVASQMQDGVQQSTTVTVRQDEAISVEPLRILSGKKEKEKRSALRVPIG